MIEDQVKDYNTVYLGVRSFQVNSVLPGPEFTLSLELPLWVIILRDPVIVQISADMRQIQA